MEKKIQTTKTGLVLGIIGRIGSGKSEVLRILSERGFFCIDTDKIVHDLYKPDGLGAKRIAVTFGDEFLLKEGSVDRVKLREDVFSDIDRLKYLNNVMHPVVYEEVCTLLLGHSADFVAIESVYFDYNFLGDFVDKILWVERGEEEILRVLLEERGFEEEMACKVMRLVRRPENVDYEVVNDGSLADLKGKVMALKI